MARGVIARRAGAVGLVAAGLLVVVLVLVARGALDRLDLGVVRDLEPAVRPRQGGLGDRLVGDVTPLRALLVCGLLAALAAVSASRARAVAVVGLLLAANLGGLALEPCCEREVAFRTGGFMVASAPSNHLVLVTSVAMAVVLLVPASLRLAAAAVAGLTAAGASVALVVALRHTLSDVLAAWLVTAAATGAALWAEPRIAARLRSGRPAP